MAEPHPALRADGDGATLLRVRVVPRASRSELAGLHGDAVKARVAAPPVDGKANAALLQLLAGVLDVRRRDLTVVAGATTRDKVVRVAVGGPAAVAARLRAGGA